MVKTAKRSMRRKTMKRKSMRRKQRGGAEMPAPANQMPAAPAVPAANAVPAAANNQAAAAPAAAANQKPQAGGKRKSRKLSPWNKFVAKVYAEMKKMDKSASFSQALKEASKRKKKGQM